MRAGTRRTGAGRTPPPRAGRPARPAGEPAAAGRGGWVRQILPMLRPRGANVVLVLAATVVSAAVSAALPLVQRRILDDALAGTRSLLAPLAALVGLGALAYLAQRTAMYRELKAANDAQFVLYDRVHRRVQQSDGDRSVSAGQLVARLNADVGALARGLAALPRLLGAVLSTGAVVVLMLALNPLLGAVTLLVVPLLQLVVLRARRRVQPATWRVQQQEAVVAELVNQVVTGVRVVKAFGCERREVDRMRAASGVLVAARLRLIRLQAWYQPLLESLPAFMQAAVVLVGGWRVLDHRMSLGTFLAFSAYSGQLVLGVKGFADTALALQEAGVCARRVLELLDLAPAVVERPDAGPLPPVRGEVRFEGVRFGYRDGPDVLDGLSLRVAPGETVALVGSSGAGKSTAVEMVARLHDPRAGAVLVDGVDLRDATLASLRSQVGVVFEEPFLFSGTIRDNITYGRPGVDERALVRAARTAGAHGFIEQLPGGYDTPVGERGLTLSGGQRQRIALARALLTDPRVLVLDNATGAVDAKLERQIHRRLRAGAVGRTTIMVAYRASTLALADRVVVVDAGRVVDQGSHHELLARCPLYRRLVDPAGAPEPGTEAAVGEEGGPLGAPAPGAVGCGAPVRGAGDGNVDPGGVAGRELAGHELAGPGDDPRLDACLGDGARFSLWRFIWPYRLAFGFALVLVGVQTAAGVLGPYLTQQAVDRGIVAGSVPGLVLAALGVLATTLAGLLVATAAMRVSGRVGQRLVHALRVRLWERLLRMPVRFYERQRTGRLLTRMVNDVEAFSDLFSGGLATTLVAALTLTGVLAAMVVVSPPLAAVVVAVLLPFLASLWWFNRRMTAAYGWAREQVANVNAALQENLSGIREAQAYGQQERQHAEYARLVRRYLDARLAAERLVATALPITSFLSGAASALVLGLGAGMLAAGSLTPGALIALVLWVNLFFAPILQLSTFFTDWQRIRVSTVRINRLLREPAGPAIAARPARPAPIRGELALCGVRFRYADGDTDALCGIDLAVPAGRTLAIVGPTGAGKSTIVKLLAAFYHPAAGRVLVDGRDLRSLDLAGYRARLGYISQEPFLFSGTVRDNIAYGRPDASDAEVIAAAAAVGAHQAICALPGGYAHVVGQRGDGLSAGQRQLVCLARAYLVDPAIVLLDEATANLDLATEARVLAAMRAVASGRTTIMIAHRLQSARGADLIAVVSDGRVVERGSHRELMAAGGRYAELYRASLVAPV